MTRWVLSQECKVGLTYENQCDMPFKINADKAFDKINTLSDKSTQETRNRMHFLNMIKARYTYLKKHITNIIFNGKRFKIRNKTRILAFATSIQKV